MNLQRPHLLKAHIKGFTRCYCVYGDLNRNPWLAVQLGAPGVLILTRNRSWYKKEIMDRVRQDVVIHELKARRYRMALCVLFLPAGYSLSKSTERKTQPPSDSP